MLYDTKWDQKTKTDPFSLESLIAWLEKQPAEKAYDYCDPWNCLLCQYFAAMGFEDVRVSENHLSASSGEYEFSRVFNWDIANCNHTADETFGRALMRARKIAGRRR